MTHPRTALVIGGGIAGPVTALALRKAGISATVHEAYDSPADGIGGYLSIAPNGLHALGVLGAGDVVPAIGTPMRSMIVRSWTGKRLAEFGGGPGEPPVGQLVWRPDLYRALHDEAARVGIRTEFGRRLVGAEETPDGVTAHFADGSTATADLLIGADGIRSTVRSLIDAAAPGPRYTGLVSFGGKVADTGLPSTDGAMHMVFGRRAFFGYLVEADGSAGWFVNLPRKVPMTLAEARAVPAGEWLRELRAVFAADRVPAADLIGRTNPAELLIVGPMEDIPTVPTWSRGRMVLVGDSAHATSPSSGQGASLAVESAVQLARCLRDLPVDRAFAAYEGLRRARVERIIALAARTNSNKAAGPVARVFRDLLMPAMMRLMARPGRMDWQFGYEIDWDAPVPDPADRALAGA
ncbi:NAD(P)/FAD-dependent oxidoreductase [Longispora sp. K20-0274]|uniref:FAD-dependent oxidoreductase n=1 Tax=Longispora sp. K20-0274 TaxID=3088255 RepID=UPI00399AB7C3